MLERARATSLALLGATAAVGLAIVALALNQSWPLLEGSSIPAPPRQAVGGASVVALPPKPAPRAAAGRRRPDSGARQTGAGAPARPQAPLTGRSGGEKASTLVVSAGAPARSGGGGSPKAPPTPGKGPANHSQPTQTAPQQAPAPTASPPSQEPAPPSPAPTPAPAPAPTQPEAVVSEAPPEESSVPPWSNGKGHAYGRGGHEPGHGWGGGED